MEKENINTIIERLPQDLKDRIVKSGQEMRDRIRESDKEFGFPERTDAEIAESIQGLMDTFEAS